MCAYVLGLHEVDRRDIALVGGKGASLGELSRLEGIGVPEGFCVTTEAFKHVMGAAPAVRALVDRLAALEADDRAEIQRLGAELRGAMENIALPDNVQQAITRVLGRSGEQVSYAVRSSATAEDLPGASFAGQQDTYLNVVGLPAILRHISRCWASLFTDRAIAYRQQHRIDHRKVHMAVVVQTMVFPQAAGVMFTADLVTGHRRVTSIEACFGLGESLVSGIVNADGYKLRNGQVIEKKIATKNLATRALPDGGTKEQALEPGQQQIPVLADAQLLGLERIGRKLEAHFGQPQDIEWCLDDTGFHIVQSRPITTLFPVPQAGDQGNHVYVSVGHQQMMTDPMRPLGLSLWQLTAARPMFAAGGRLFVNIAKELASPVSRSFMLNPVGGFDPLTKDALTTLVERGGFVEAAPPAVQGTPAGPPPQSEADPAIVPELIARSQAALDQLKRNIRTKSGTQLLEFILEDVQQMRKTNVDGKTMAAILAVVNAVSWINGKVLEWLGEKNAADALSQSVANNVTSEMGLALLDVADVMRQRPQVIAYLQRARDEGFFEGLLALDGGREAHDAIRTYLDQYGMRCAGEIDITRARWSESPTTLVPIILSNIRNFEAGAGGRKFEQGKQEAAKKEQELLERLKQLPDCEHKAGETQRMISGLRSFAGYREHPKYAIVNRYAVYKQALLEEAERLVQAGVFSEKEDIFYVTLQELVEVVRTHTVDPGLIRQRKAEHDHNAKLSPPRVITSDGEVIAGVYQRAGLPAGALAGLAVSAGVVEGRARVLLDMADAELEPGDILVTTFTDPSWTPLFVSIKGLVTEVGGLMTHGAVIAREYGLPAVICVKNATRLIKDGQRIRVNGTDGYVELLA